MSTSINTPRTKHTIKLPTIVMAALIPVFLTACSTAPLTTATSPGATATAAITTPEQAKSINLRLAQARRLGYPERAIKTLDITDELLESSPIRARLILGQLPYDLLPLPQQAELAVQQARIAHINKNDAEVFDWLDRKAVVVSNDPTIRAQAHSLKALAYTRLTEYQAALDEWLLAGPFLSSAEREGYYDIFWQALINNPEQRLNDLYKLSAPRNLRGWLALALVYRGSLNLDEKITALELWQKNWSHHPARKYLPSDFNALKQSALSRPDKIAVLLPLSGRLAHAGMAARDGIMACHYESMNSDVAQPEWLFYDTEGSNINELASTAINDGAQLIIGPLDKNQVKELNSDTTHRVPVLALNSAEFDGEEQPELRPGFYQFGLFAEDEAIMAAERGWLDGHRTAIIITPNTEWGKKVNESFKVRWEELGGKVVGSSEFSGSTQFSKMAGWLLHTDQSETRAQQLNRLLKDNLGFQARRRDDVDMVFIGASPQEARQIKPALAYQYAGSLPVYATSSTYSGTTNTTLDQDLNDIRVPVMPWLAPNTENPLQQQIENLWPQSKGQLGTLYALGADACQLYPRLQQLVTLQGSQLPGLTGALSMTPDGKVHRELSWQIFQRGRLMPLPEPTNNVLEAKTQ